jgi:SpoVK/Ycf46/Vps4 family AAA+-type ATPase
MASVDDPGLSHIQTQLEGLNVNMNNLRRDFKAMLKKEEIEVLIKSTLTDIMSTLEEKLKVYIQNELTLKTKHLNDKIDSLEFEKKELKEKLVSVETIIENNIIGHK